MVTKANELDKLIEMESFYLPHSMRERIETKFRDFIHEEPRLNSSVSFVGNKKMPILRLYRYKEAFAYGFVEQFLRRLNINVSDYVFDPFAGMGTTLFTSMLHGIQSIGVEKLPVAYFISKTLPLFLSIREKELSKIYQSLISRVPKSIPAEIAADVPIMKIAFNDETLFTLRKLKAAIEELDYPYNDIFLLLFFSIIEECSFTCKDGQFLRLKPNKKISEPIRALNKKVEQAEEDISRINNFFPGLVRDEKFVPDIHLSDARDLSNVRFRQPPTLILTSPPYANRYDYTRSYSLELCFHFVKNFEELKTIRFGILRSHIESKIQEGETPNHPVIKEVIEALSNKKLNNPKIPDMITAYFIDMEKAIKEWSKVLANGAKVAMVVDNVRFEGELIPVDLVLSEMAENVGLKVKEVIVARYKGNSSQQMGKYGRVPVRESIVVWEKK